MQPSFVQTPTEQLAETAKRKMRHNHREAVSENPSLGFGDGKQVLSPSCQ